MPAGALPLDPVGGSAPKPRPAFEKSGGKPAGKLFWVCNGLCWPAAHWERRARLVCGKAGRERTVDGSFGRWNIPAFRAGRRARTARTKQERGPLAPAPALVLRALRARQTPPPPRRNPTTPANPSRQRTPAGPTAVGQARRKVGAFLRGAAAFRGRGQRPRPLNMLAAGLARLRAGGLRPPAAAVRKGRCASPPKRLPSTPLLTGLPPRFFRHWRRSALPPCRF